MGLINSHHFGQIQIAPRLGFSMEAIVMPQSEGAFAWNVAPNSLYEDIKQSLHTLAKAWMYSLKSYHYVGVPHKSVTLGSSSYIDWLIDWLVEMPNIGPFHNTNVIWLAISDLRTLHSNPCFNLHPW